MPWKRRETQRMPNVVEISALVLYCTVSHMTFIRQSIIYSLLTLCFVPRRLGQKSEYHLLCFVLPVCLVTLVEVYAGGFLHLNLCHNLVVYT